MKAVSLLQRNPLQGKISLVRQAALTALICAVAATASAQTGQPTTTGQQPAQPPAVSEAKTPQLAVALIGPARELKFAEYTWFRFGAQVQLWFKAAQDRIKQPDGSEGSYAFDFYCRRCRFFTTGSVIKNVFFNILFESSNVGKANADGSKNFPAPQILDAYGQVKFTDWFWLSGGSILMPLTRNGLQPTTTYVSLDVGFTSTSPILQGNSNVLRDLGVQANGFLFDYHLEYRLGAWQGSRQGPIPTQLSSHNGPRLIGMLAYNFWDIETGYVNGGHYYGTKKVLGLMANFDYQDFRKALPATTPYAGAAGTGAGALGAGVDKNAYYGVSAAAFINYPLSGSASPKGGDELVGLAQFGYYDGGLRGSLAAPTNFGTYPLVAKQYDFLFEAGYYNNSGHFSIFGKFEERKLNGDYDVAARNAFPNPSQWWAAGGVKYYVGPSNTMNFTLQYERVYNIDAPDTQQSGTNNFTFQMQTILY